MDIHLVVVRPFAGFARGDIVTDAARISEILKGEHVFSTVRVAGPAAKES